MLYGLILTVHILVSLFLIAVILLQGGRGGLGEALGGQAAQSLFGGGANIVMTRLTAIVGALFMATCLSLAALSTARGGSVIDRLPAAGSPLALPTQPSPAASPRPPQEPSAVAPVQLPAPEAELPALPIETPPPSAPSPAPETDTAP